MGGEEYLEYNVVEKIDGEFANGGWRMRQK